jgi:tyrosinase
MSKKSFECWQVSRRKFLTTTAATVLSAAIPYRGAAAQGTPTWRRVNLSDPKTPQDVKSRVLASYKKAVGEMLKRPPEDPLNWYRNALIHTVDCPHGNWWFLVWHRGYIGWFEKKCRELSGDPLFALPYWDWTAEHRVPDYMFEDVLDPNNDAFIGKHDDFKSIFKDAVRKLDYWELKKNGTPTDRYGQLLARGLRFPDDLWFDIIENPPTENPPDPALNFQRDFFDQPGARGLKKGEDFDEVTIRAVVLPALIDALSPRDFQTFASLKAVAGHNIQSVGFGVLENQMHNRIHNCVGGSYNHTEGFMLNFMSPVDPVFFLHHANIDRLWDVWTRKQEAHKNLQYPTLPDGYRFQLNSDEEQISDYHLWRTEPFLFFIDEKGNPVAGTAGDYANTGAFDYDYQPGSGEEVVTVPAKAAMLVIPPIQRFTGEVTISPLTATQAASGAVTIPPAMLQAAAEPGGPKLFAKITVVLLGHTPLTVLINAPPGSMEIAPSSPYFAGTLDMFGSQVMHGPVTFTLPLSMTLSALRASNLLAVNQPLDIRVVPSTMPQAAMGAAVTARVVSILVEVQ